MPETENKYNRGKIYKIVCNKTGLIYVGSTTEKLLSRRLTLHRSNYKQYKQGSLKNFTTSIKVLENGDYDIVLLEAYSCNSKDELYQQERFYIESLPCVNKYVPIRTEDESNAKIKEYKTKYYEDNKETIREKSKLHREQNIEKIREYHRIRSAKKREFKKTLH